MKSKKLKRFVFDLNKVARGKWFCGHRACIMGQFALQNGYDKNKNQDVYKFCGNKLVGGSKLCGEVISENDSHKSWDEKLKKLRKLFRDGGYQLIVKRKK